MARPRFPEVKSDRRAMRGGLDLVTPALERDPGRCFSAQNYEPGAVGGYRRINGYERSDGQASPTGKSYWVISATITGTVTTAATLTGATSAATGKVLGTFGTVIVLGRVTGTFQSGEALQIAAATVATSTSTAEMDGAVLPSDHADYKLLAADDWRAEILVVPGSGRIRGGFTLNDVTYAFRDNAGGTAGDMYKQTASGWSKIAFGKEIQFTGAVGQISDGQTVTGLTSGASAPVVRSMLRTGTWTVSGAGTLVLGTITGTFQSGEALQVGGVTKATSSSLATDITRAVGGVVEAVVDNFTGTTVTKRAYGVDGVNKAFEFDGTYYIPIRTGMTTDTPTHVCVHKNHLFLSFASSIQYSGITAPYSWTVLTGANEINCGDAVSGFLGQSGTEAGAALAIFTSGKMNILYGSSSADFQRVPSGEDVGFSAYTMQIVGNTSYGLTARGVQSLRTTQSYGNFAYTSLSVLVEPLLKQKVGLQCASVSLRSKNQYRLFFTDGTGLIFGLTGDKTSGILNVDYGIPVRCMWNATLSTGEEVTFFGSDDGYVYQDNVGTSFDGDEIESWIRPAFNNLGSPHLRKQYRWAKFEVECDGYAEVNATYDLGYGSPDVEPAAAQQDQTLIGAGGYWDQFTWDSFTWDAPVITSAQLSIDGCETNISFLFYSSRAQDDPHTLQGVSLLFSPRRLARGGS